MVPFVLRWRSPSPTGLDAPISPHEHRQTPGHPRPSMAPVVHRRYRRPSRGPSDRRPGRRGRGRPSANRGVNVRQRRRPILIALEVIRPDEADKRSIEQPRPSRQHEVGTFYERGEPIASGTIAFIGLRRRGPLHRPVPARSPVAPGPGARSAARPSQASGASARTTRSARSRSRRGPTGAAADGLPPSALEGCEWLRPTPLP